ncbi:MAG: hypothetical protein ACFFG0_04420 [Candidatus Thorarchaeota archaeon]
MGGIGAVLGGIGGILGGIGAVSGGGDSGSTSVSQVEQLTPQQKELLDYLAIETKKELQRPTIPFAGQLTAPLSELQQQAISSLPELQQAISTPESALRAFTEAVEEPALRQFGQEIVPGIQARFNAIGAGSSSGLNRALASAGRELTKDLAAQKAGFLENAQQRRLSELFGLTTLTSTFGDLQRQQQQQDISAQFNEFLRTQQLPRAAFSIAGNPLAVQAYQPLIESIQPAASPLSGLTSSLGYLLGQGNTGGGLFNFGGTTTAPLNTTSSLGGYASNFALPNFLQGVI